MALASLTFQGNFHLFIRQVSFHLYNLLNPIIYNTCHYNVSNCRNRYIKHYNCLPNLVKDLLEIYSYVFQNFKENPIPKFSTGSASQLSQANRNHVDKHTRDCLCKGVLISPQPDLLLDVFCLMVRIFHLMLVLLYIRINSTNIPPIMIINRIYEHQNLLSLQLVSFLVGLRTYQLYCIYTHTHIPGC